MSKKYSELPKRYFQPYHLTTTLILWAVFRAYKSKPSLIRMKAWKSEARK